MTGESTSKATVCGKGEQKSIHCSPIRNLYYILRNITNLLYQCLTTYLVVLQSEIFVVDAAFAGSAIGGIEIDDGVIVSIEEDFDDAVPRSGVGAEISRDDAGFVADHDDHLQGRRRRDALGQHRQ